MPTASPPGTALERAVEVWVSTIACGTRARQGRHPGRGEVTTLSRRRRAAPQPPGDEVADHVPDLGVVRDLGQHQTRTSDGRASRERRRPRGPGHAADGPGELRRSGRPARPACGRFELGVGERAALVQVGQPLEATGARGRAAAATGAARPARVRELAMLTGAAAPPGRRRPAPSAPPPGSAVGVAASAPERITAITSANAIQTRPAWSRPTGRQVPRRDRPRAHARRPCPQHPQQADDERGALASASRSVTMVHAGPAASARWDSWPGHRPISLPATWRPRSARCRADQAEPHSRTAQRRSPWPDRRPAPSSASATIQRNADTFLSHRTIVCTVFS